MAFGKHQLGLLPLRRGRVTPVGRRGLSASFPLAWIDRAGAIGAWPDGEVAGERDKTLSCLCQSIDRNEGIDAKGNHGDGNDNRQADTPGIETTALA